MNKPYWAKEEVLKTMDKEKRSKYAEILLKAYQNNAFKIVWSASGYSMVVDSKKKDLFPEIKEKEFVEYAFSVIKIIVDLVEQEAIDEKNESDLEAARFILDREPGLKNHLYIKRNSKIDCFKRLECEIISHRNEEEPICVEATSAIVKVIVEKNEEDISYMFETSIRDLNDIIGELTELKKRMQMIETGK